MMEPSLLFILNKFPEHRSRISELFYKYKNFRNLSEDLLFTIQKLEECRTAAQINGEVEGDYLQAYLDLERELIDYFNKTDR